MILPPGIDPLDAEQSRWQGNLRMGFYGGGNAFERIGDQIIKRHAVVHQAMDEEGVGAVLQQSPHQVGSSVRVKNPTERRSDTVPQGRQS